MRNVRNRSIQHPLLSRILRIAAETALASNRYLPCSFCSTELAGRSSQVRTLLNHCGDRELVWVLMALVAAVVVVVNS